MAGAWQTDTDIAHGGMWGRHVGVHRLNAKLHMYANAVVIQPPVRPQLDPRMRWVCCDRLEVWTTTPYKRRQDRGITKHVP